MLINWYPVKLAMVCSLFEIAMSFLPPKTLKRLFPPMVSGVTIFLIGCSVISTALKDWAGGSGNCASMPSTGLYSLCPNTEAPHPLPWGSAEFIGLGFSVFVTIVIVENFGSPFMKSAQVNLFIDICLLLFVLTEPLLDHYRTNCWHDHCWSNRLR